MIVNEARVGNVAIMSGIAIAMPGNSLQTNMSPGADKCVRSRRITIVLFFGSGLMLSND